MAEGRHAECRYTDCRGAKAKLSRNNLECFTQETHQPSSNILLMKATTVVHLA